ncbi:Serine/threonine protein kinase [Lishizhenia tianjinensis]|uniref:Serine/threonine protein kinase n=1 Tax=Lishizhenia tianjinensis TaxID=477690 RepID=A0A1I7AFK7_9FLAO|nr:protein kinase [Lishizhenia tianjinensis]SFT73696.1 Serine/threonine protein kinase [Lishizhenia tianjinensis]
MLSAYKFLDTEISQNKRKFSATHVVEDIQTGCHHILKIASLKDEKAVNVLKNERLFTFASSSLQSSLKHWEEEGKFYLLKEFFEGENLLSFYKKLKRRERKKFLPQFLFSFSKLLDEVHNQHLLHLDIKPSNIIISGDINAFEVKLIDFGLAWRYMENSSTKRKSYYPFGHAAPELVLNVPELFVPQTDYYALGILMYELMEEELPFLHPNPVQSINLQLNLPLPTLSRKWRKYQGLLNKLTAKESFAKPPNQYTREQQGKVLLKGILKRYQNLGEMRKDLENIHSIA